MTSSSAARPRGIWNRTHVSLGREYPPLTAVRWYDAGREETKEAKSSVEPHNCGYWVVGICLSLASPADAFQEGHTVESPCQFLPVLMLEQVDDYWGARRPRHHLKRP